MEPRRTGRQTPNPAARAATAAPHAVAPCAAPVPVRPAAGNHPGFGHARLRRADGALQLASHPAPVLARHPPGQLPEDRVVDAAKDPRRVVRVLVDGGPARQLAVQVGHDLQAVAVIPVESSRTRRCTNRCIRSCGICVTGRGRPVPPRFRMMRWPRNVKPSSTWVIWVLPLCEASHNGNYAKPGVMRSQDRQAA